MLRILRIKINSSSNDIFRVLEFLKFLAISELIFLYADSYKKEMNLANKRILRLILNSNLLIFKRV